MNEHYLRALSLAYSRKLVMYYRLHVAGVGNRVHGLWPRILVSCNVVYQHSIKRHVVHGAITTLQFVLRQAASCSSRVAKRGFKTGGLRLIRVNKFRAWIGDPPLAAWEIGIPSHRPRAGHPRHVYSAPCQLSNNDIVSFVHVIELDNEAFEVENVLRREHATGEFIIETWINGVEAHNVNAIRALEDLRTQINTRGKIF